MATWMTGLTENKIATTALESNTAQTFDYGGLYVSMKPKTGSKFNATTAISESQFPDKI